MFFLGTNPVPCRTVHACLKGVRRLVVQHHKVSPFGRKKYCFRPRHLSSSSAALEDPIYQVLNSDTMFTSVGVPPCNPSEIDALPKIPGTFSAGSAYVLLQAVPPIRTRLTGAYKERKKEQSMGGDLIGL